MFDRLDWLGLPVYVGVPLVFLFLGNPNNNPRDRAFWRNVRTKVVFAPPALVFVVVWNLLFPLIGISGLLFWHGFEASSCYTLTLALWWGNVLVLAVWYQAFFRLRWVLTALLVNFMLAATAVAVVVLFGPVSGAWTSFGLYIGYAGWAVLQMIINLVSWIRPLPREARDLPVDSMPMQQQVHPRAVDSPKGTFGSRVHGNESILPMHHGRGAARSRSTVPVGSAPAGDSRDAKPMLSITDMGGGWSKGQTKKKIASSGRKFAVGELRLPGDE